MTTIKENGIYKAKIKTKENGLNILSMVENPAIDINYIKMNEDKVYNVKLSVIDEGKGIVIAPALVPEMLIPRVYNGLQYYISFDKETIEESLIKMSEERKDNNVDLNHSEQLINGVVIMEKFITDENRVTSVKNFEHSPFGTLFFTAKVIDEKLMSDIKAGKINGWSIDGFYDLEIEEDVELTEDEIKILNESVTN